MNRPSPSWAPPITFLFIVMTGYSGLRVYSLMPDAAPVSGPDAVRATAKTLANIEQESLSPERIEMPSDTPLTRAEAAWSPSSDAPRPWLGTKIGWRIPIVSPPWRQPSQGGVAFGVAPGLIFAEGPGSKTDQHRATPISPPLLIVAPPGSSPRNREARPLFGYGWIVIRGGLAPSPLLPSLGGSQAGFKLDWNWNRTIGMTGRVVSTFGTRPIGGHQREAAIGLSYFPSRDRTMALTVERRFSLGGGRDAWQLRFAGGNSWAVNGWTLEGYGQAGVTGLHRRDGFAEGQFALRKPINIKVPVHPSVGVSAWAAAQPGAERIDIGPQAVVNFKLGVPVRLSVDYRVRIAGKALPTSGPALTLSTDF